MRIAVMTVCVYIVFRGVAGFVEELRRMARGRCCFECGECRHRALCPAAAPDEAEQQARNM